MVRSSVGNFHAATANTRRCGGGPSRNRRLPQGRPAADDLRRILDRRCRTSSQGKRQADKARADGRAACADAPPVLPNTKEVPMGLPKLSTPIQLAGPAAPPVCLIALLLCTATGVPAQITPVAVGPIVIVVSDLDRAETFYTQVLSFRTAATREAHEYSFDRLTGVFGTNVRIATLELGSESIELIEYRTPRGRPVPPDSKSNDQWFQHIAIVVSDMEAASALLFQFVVQPISTAPQTLPDWNLNAAGIKALYFRDPDGHPLKLIYFPPGKGDPRWHQGQGKRDGPFLGIDHTAIAVADTERSLRFYRDVLGFRVVGESLNYGAEQDHLNHVFGSKVRITSLRSPSAPASSSSNTSPRATAGLRQPTPKQMIS